MTDEPGGGLRQELEAALEGREGLDRKAIFVGLLNKYLPPEARAVLVGGALVELYTGGGYVTMDVDLVGDRRAVRRLLLAAGFQEEGRYLYDDTLSIAVEVPGDVLRPTEVVRSLQFEGYVLPVLRPEDALVDRLLASKYWRSETDWEQALLLLRAQGRWMDMDALDEAARANQVDDVLERLRAEIGAPTDENP